MDKKPLIWISLCAVILLVLGSLCNVVGYQTIQTSQQNLIEERINQRELLFQTIVDIANNKEIQRIIVKSQMTNGKFPDSDAKLPTTINKQNLRQMYFIGLILSKVISKSRIQSMIQQYQLFNTDIQKQISAVIEKDPLLEGDFPQVQNSECDCENENIMVWHFPIVCMVLYPIVLITFYLLLLFNSYFFFQVLYCLIKIEGKLHCKWW